MSRPVKPRMPGTVADAVLRILGVLGVAEAAAVVGKSEGLLRQWSDPDQPGRPSLEQAIALDAAYVRATGDKAPLLAVYLRDLAEATRDAPAPVVGPVLVEILDVETAMGRLTERLREAFSPAGDGGRAMTPRERMAALETMGAIHRELDDVETALKGEGGE